MVRARGRSLRRDYRLMIGDPDTVAASVVLAPPLSLLAAVRHVVASRSASAGPRDPLRDALRPHHRFATDPLGADTMVIPDVYLPLSPRVDMTIAQHAECLRDMPDAAVADEVHARFGRPLPPVWAAVADHPRRWRESWAAASVELWEVLSARWQAAERQLDREVRRVSMAIARGGLEPLLNSLHPRLAFQAGTIGFDGGHDAIHTLSGRRLVLVPLIGAGGDVLVSFDRPELAYIAYPLRNVERLAVRPHAAGDDLRAVLGDIRSSALRALVRPHTVGELAAEMGVSAATMSYHCDSLESAGLVHRSRAGRRVLVSRTFRGAELTELFSA